MSQAIQSQIKSNPDNSRHGLFHHIIFVLRHGLKRNHKFLDLFPYLKIFFPWRSGSFIWRTVQLRTLAISATFSLVMLTLALTMPITSETILTEAATGIEKNSTLTMSVTNPSAEVKLIVASMEGTFASSSPNATFTVKTDNYSGYTLSIQGKDNNGLLLDKRKQNSFASISSAISEATFKAEANTTYNGRWGYKPSKLNSVANSNYLPAPTTTATTLDTTNAPNSTANSYTIAVGARADFSMSPADYTNTFIITAIANVIQYNISYTSNTMDTVTNMPSAQTGISSGVSIELSDDIPIRTNYIFMGWNTKANGSGTTFSPGAEYKIDETISNAIILYAMWERDIVIPFGGVATMQGITASICSEVAIGNTGRVRDTRDDKYYWIAKLADGNCWMTQNLDLDITADGLLAIDTDITEDWKSSSAYAPTATATGNPPTDGCKTQSTINGIITYIDTCSYDPGDYVLKNPGSWTRQTGTTNLTTNAQLVNISEYTNSSFDSSVGGTVSGSSITAVDEINLNYDAHYHIGNYYQFNTATAGKGAMITSSSGEVANSSICPKGWKLPLSETNNNNVNGSFYKLLNAYEATVSPSTATPLKLVSAPLYMVPGGYARYDSNGLYNAGYYGDYWSRISYSQNNSYNLSFVSGSTNASNNYARYYGFSVRCVVPTS